MREIGIETVKNIIDSSIFRDNEPLNSICKRILYIFDNRYPKNSTSIEISNVEHNKNPAKKLIEKNKKFIAHAKCFSAKIDDLIKAENLLMKMIDSMLTDKQNNTLYGIHEILIGDKTVLTGMNNALITFSDKLIESKDILDNIRAINENNKTFDERNEYDGKNKKILSRIYHYKSMNEKMLAIYKKVLYNYSKTIQMHEKHLEIMKKVINFKHKMMKFNTIGEKQIER
jgi:hypothetical protein